MQDYLCEPIESIALDNYDQTEIHVDSPDDAEPIESKEIADDSVSLINDGTEPMLNEENAIESPRVAKARDYQHVANQIAADREKVRFRNQSIVHDKASAYSRILTAKNSQTVIPNARIIGAEELPITDDDGRVEHKVVVACCMVYDIMAYIPIEELWLRLPPGLEQLR